MDVSSTSNAPATAEPAGSPLVAAMLLTSFLAIGGSLSAQITHPPAPPAEIEPGSELVVYLMTMGEGDMVWERFGHNAIWIHDPVSNTDHTYNWGLFDFDEPGFLRRFIQGRMLYAMDAFDAHRTIQGYAGANRSVWVQELNLTPAQRRDLVQFVEWNRLPENRYYRYDYYYDNCSTRVRDALDRALGGEIRRQTAHAPSGETFRSHSRRLTANDVPTYTGLTIGLGPGVDREISRWEEMFLPLAMRDIVQGLTVDDGRGGRVPLVRSERAVFIADRPTLPDAPPRWWPGYLLAGLVLAGAFLGLGHFAGRSGLARAAFAGLGVLWGLVVGLLGVVLAGLWAFTDHAAAYRNENLFQFNPLALALIALLPALIYRPGRLGAWAVPVSGTLAVSALLGALLKPLPWLIQVNGDILVLMLPVHLAVAVTTFLLAREPSESGP
jgi:hypothetical protein